MHVLIKCIYGYKDIIGNQICNVSIEVVTFLSMKIYFKFKINVDPIFSALTA
jgi:hypothetical protein